MPCSLANASMAAYFARFFGSVFWISWSRANTGCSGSRTFFAPSPLNFDSTAEVLSWVMTWSGRIVTKSFAWTSHPRVSPTACACVIFSMTVWAMIVLRERPEGRGAAPARRRSR